MAETLEIDSRMEPVSVDSNTKIASFRDDSEQKFEFQESSKKCAVRAEIDTSAPFESVKEAVSRFGGIGFWKPSQQKLPDSECEAEEIDVEKLEEQAMELEKELIVKERETLDVLKELEITKITVEDLKSKLQKETFEVNDKRESSHVDHEVKTADEENHEGFQHNSVGGLISCPSSAPGLILMELKQAKLNLSRTTNDLADIRASVETLNKKLEKERSLLEKTREKLSLSSSKVSSLEEELNQTRLKLQLAKDNKRKGGYGNPSDITTQLQKLSSEAEQFKKIGEAAKSEVLRAISEIEQTKSKIKTAGIRLIAAQKMKEAARASEALALAEIKAISNSESSLESVTLSSEEYSSLTCKARDAYQHSKRRVIDAMQQVDEANISKMEILKRVEEATEEVKTSKRTLEKALNRVEAANSEKLAVEEALRKWRSEHGQKRRSVHNNTKFKTSCPTQHRREPRLLDVNGLNLVSDVPMPILKQTLSIGQILSRKLLSPEESEREAVAEKVKRKVSLGQMLGKQKVGMSSSLKSDKGSGKQFTGKRKKMGFGRISLLLSKQHKKKKTTLNLR